MINSNTFYYHTKIWWIVLGMMTNTLTFAQVATYTTPLTLLGKKNQITVPFEYQQGFIVVKVYMENFLSLNFIFDTGAENTILLKSSIADLLQLPCNKKLTILGADLSSKINAYVSNNINLRIENSQSVKQNIIVMEENYSYLEECIGIKIDGILGAEFFKGLILRIDYKSKQITIFNPKKISLQKLTKYKALPITLHKNKPYLTCTAAVNQGANTSVKMLLDTGAGLSALFHDNTDTMLCLPHKIVKGQLGVGLGGDIVGFNGKIHKLSIGEFVLPNLISSFQSLEEALIDTSKLIRNGLIGNLILERFDIYLDLNDSMIYLKPYKNFDKPIKYDKSGLTIFSFGVKLDQYYVKSIIEGSPADEAGVMIGDVITKVGCWPVSIFSLNTIVNKLCGKSGKVLVIKVERAQKVFKYSIILRDLF